MKDLLTFIIVILIIGIVLDGIRRMRAARRESLAMSKNNFDDNDFEVSSSEFPSGGARVARERDESDADSLNENVRKGFESTRVTAGAPNRIPEQVSLNLEESVPMLMDSVEEESSEEDDQYQEELVEDAPSQNPSLDTLDTSEELPEVSDHKEPSIGNLDGLDDVGLSAPRDASAKQEATSKNRDASPKREANSAKEAPKPAKQAKPEKEPAQESQQEDNYSEPDEVLIMNIMARPGERIAGEALLNGLMSQGLKFGEMEIFHRHKDNDGDGPILYSIANMVVPGTFNLAEMNEFSTPGISIFLSLPVASESIAAYNDMASTAKNLAEQLGAELKDENRSVMTAQTIEHGRQRVIEYERKRKLARA